jgi:hypothetical protein
MKKILKFFFFPFAALLVALFALSRIEVRIPDKIVERITDSISSSNWLVRADSVFWNFPKKIRIEGGRLFDCTKVHTAPFLSFEKAEIKLAFSRFPIEIDKITESVTVSGLRMPRLPDGYYIPDSIEFPGQADFTERNSPIQLDLPPFRGFKLQLKDVDVLDLRAKHVSVKQVRSSGGVLSFDGIRVEFPDKDVPMSVTGHAELNIPAQRVSGDVHGQARQANIRPMLQALDIANCYQFIDAFTGVTVPVDAGCKFDVNLRNSDLRIFLDLHPTGGAYRGVRFESAQGNIDIRVFVRNHCQNAHINVGPIAARFPGGESMSGAVFYENTNDVGYVSFRDVKSVTSLSNALAVADILNDGTLDCLQPETPPVIMLNGTVAVDPANAASNRLDGSISFASGKFFGIPLKEASSLFKLRAEKVDFIHAEASMPHGGKIQGAGAISFPGYREDLAAFSVDLSGEDLSLSDIAETLGLEVGNREGTVSGTFQMEAPLSTSLVSRVNGKGRVKIENGHLARLNLFAGLTDYLAKNIPGISSLVDQSNAEMEFTMTNGVIRTENLTISGDVFFISGFGSYSIPDDHLDFTARVRLFKNDSFIGKLTSPFTWTFSKLLLEFNVRGPIDKPEWNYISVLERLK